jgi:hypothetical protein
MYDSFTCEFLENVISSDEEDTDSSVEEREQRASVKCGGSHRDNNGARHPVSILKNGSPDAFFWESIPMKDSRASTGAEDRIVADRAKDPTPLYNAIEAQNWNGVDCFLRTGRWMRTLLPYSSVSLQVRTWVTKTDYEGAIKWRRLPLHAAILFLAPVHIVAMLVTIYPESVKCTDCAGRLPVHSAFGAGASDEVVALLIETFPSGLHVRDLRGHLPVECANPESKKERDYICQSIARAAREEAIADIGKGCANFIWKTGKELSLAGLSRMLENKKLPEIIYELLKDRKKLQELLVKRDSHEKLIAEPEGVAGLERSTLPVTKIAETISPRPEVEPTSTPVHRRNPALSLGCAFSPFQRRKLYDL